MSVISMYKHHFWRIWCQTSVYVTPLVSEISFSDTILAESGDRRQFLWHYSWSLESVSLTPFLETVVSSVSFFDTNPAESGVERQFHWHHSWRVWCQTSVSLASRRRRADPGNDLDPACVDLGFLERFSIISWSCSRWISLSRFCQGTQRQEVH